MTISQKGFTEIEKLGKGGMGEVFTAYDVSLKRKVVLKKMTQSRLPDQQPDGRFEKWATYAMALHHDNIIPIYDFWMENGEECFTMEYIDGCDLEKLLNRGEFPREIGIMIALQALKGLHFIHQKGLVHGDFKPNNILVSKNGKVKIADFELTTLTSQAQFPPQDAICYITPAYMPPEAAKRIMKLELSGNALMETTPISAESMSMNDRFEAMNGAGDIWSAGVLLYRVLCGRLPFTGETFSDLFQSIINSKEPDFLACMPFIPIDLANAVTACLAKEPQSRLSSLDPLIRSLEFFIFDMGFRDIEKEIRKYMVHNNSVVFARRLDLVMTTGISFLNRAIDLLLYRLKESKINSKFAMALTHGLNALMGVTFNIYSFIITSRATMIALTASIIIFIYFGIGITFYHVMYPKDVIVHEEESAKVQTEEQPSAEISPTTPQADTASYAQDEYRAPIQAQPAAPQQNVPYKKPKNTITHDREKSEVSENSKESIENPNTKRKPAESAVLKLTLQPLTALVLLDGKDLSLRDIENGKSVKPGLHAIIAQAPGFETYQDTVTVVPGAAKAVNVVLTQVEKAVGLVHVYSYPWSDLYIDGALQGTTPTPKPLAFLEGEHTVQLKRQGYLPYSQTILVKKGQITRIRINLERSELSENLSD